MLRQEGGPAGNFGKGGRLICLYGPVGKKREEEGIPREKAEGPVRGFERRGKTCLLSGEKKKVKPQQGKNGDAWQASFRQGQNQGSTVFHRPATKKRGGKRCQWKGHALHLKK